MAGEDAFDGLAQLEVEGDDANAVKPRRKTIPGQDRILQTLLHFSQIFHRSRKDFLIEKNNNIVLKCSD
jgi:hypothetical protein